MQALTRALEQSPKAIPSVMDPGLEKRGFKPYYQNENTRSKKCFTRRVILRDRDYYEHAPCTQFGRTSLDSGVSLTHDVCTRVHAEMELDGYRKTNNDAESPQLNRASFVQPCSRAANLPLKFKRQIAKGDRASIRCPIFLVRCFISLRHYVTRSLCRRETNLFTISA